MDIKARITILYEFARVVEMKFLDTVEGQNAALVARAKAHELALANDLKEFQGYQETHGMPRFMSPKKPGLLKGVWLAARKLLMRLFGIRRLEDELLKAHQKAHPKDRVLWMLRDMQYALGTGRPVYARIYAYNLLGPVQFLVKGTPRFVEINALDRKAALMMADAEYMKFKRIAKQIAVLRKDDLVDERRLQDQASLADMAQCLGALYASFGGELTNVFSDHHLFTTNMEPSYGGAPTSPEWVQDKMEAVEIWSAATENRDHALEVAL